MLPTRAEVSAAQIERDIAAFKLEREGLDLARQGRFSDALAKCDEAIRLRPDRFGSRIAKAGLLITLKSYQEAVEELDLTLDQAIGLASEQRAVLKPTLHGVWFLRATALRELNRIEEALGSLERAIALEPDYADAWFLKGICLGTILRYREALAALDQATKIRPDYADAWLSKSLTLRRLNEQKEAAAARERAIKLDPNILKRWDEAFKPLRADIFV